jgi:hypothetical protein
MAPRLNTAKDAVKMVGSMLLQWRNTRNRNINYERIGMKVPNLISTWHMQKKPNNSDKNNKAA